MGARGALDQVRALIDDIDGVAFGKVGSLLDEMATHCDMAIKERDELVEALRELFDASKGGNVTGITENHRYEMLRLISKAGA